MKQGRERIGAVFVNLIFIIKFVLIATVEITLLWVAWVASFGGPFLVLPQWQWVVVNGGVPLTSIICLIAIPITFWLIDLVLGLLTIPFLKMMEPTKTVNVPAPESAAKQKPEFVNTFGYADDLIQYPYVGEKFQDSVDAECPACRSVTSVTESPWECPGCGAWVKTV